MVSLQEKHTEHAELCGPGQLCLTKGLQQKQNLLVKCDVICFLRERNCQGTDQYISNYLWC